MNVAIEAFGSITNENVREDNVTLEDTLHVGLQRLDELVGLDNIDKLVTGMNGDVTEALRNVCESNNLDIEVEAFYPNVSNIMDADDIDYNTAWKQGYNWRNTKMFDADAEKFPTADGLAVRLGDAGNNGAEFLNQARRKSVPAIDLNIDSVVDRSKAYASPDDESSGAEAEA